MPDDVQWWAAIVAAEESYDAAIRDANAVVAANDYDTVRVNYRNAVTAASMARNAAIATAHHRRTHGGDA